MEESHVYLKKKATGQLVQASLWDEVTDEHLASWRRLWKPIMDAYCRRHEPRDKPEDHHWNWQCKADEWKAMLGYHSFALTCEGELQGLMLLSDFRSARIQTQFGKPLVYVEFLATAPWNRPEFQRPVRYSGVGTVMIMTAVELSQQLKYHGRIGLHSLPQAESFYRGACGMTELGQDAAHQYLKYFEMTENQAEEFRQV